MRLEMNGTIVKVTLSERNLETLLAKLQGHPPNSACTLHYETEDGTFLIVSAEPDKEHYSHPERATPLAGPVHPETLAFMKRKKPS